MHYAFAVVAVSFLAVSPPAQARSATPYLIVPGKSFGAITARTTLNDLIRIYGRKNVRVGMLQPPHGDFPKQRGAVIHEGKPGRTRRGPPRQRERMAHQGRAARRNRPRRAGAHPGRPLPDQQLWPGRRRVYRARAQCSGHPRALHPPFLSREGQPGRHAENEFGQTLHVQQSGRAPRQAAGDRHLVGRSVRLVATSGTAGSRSCRRRRCCASCEAGW
jgi:hypothetical protein